MSASSGLNGGGSESGAKKSPEPGFPLDDISILREESREQLELLRTLVKLLLPKADDDGPKLEDLIAALVAQQRDILVGVRQLQSDVEALLERGEGHSERSQPPQPNGNGNGTAPI